MEQPGGVWRFDGGYFSFLVSCVVFASGDSVNTKVHLVKLDPAIKSVTLG